MSKPSQKKVPHHLWSAVTPPPLSLPKKKFQAQTEMFFKIFGMRKPPLHPSLRNVQTQAEKFLKKFGIRQPPPPLSEKCPSMNRTKTSFPQKVWIWLRSPPLWKNSKQKQIFSRDGFPYYPSLRFHGKLFYFSFFPSM